MDPTGVVGETGKQVGAFMRVMEGTPLSLALVVMNFALVAFLFYSNSQVLEQRKSAMDQVVSWQRATDILMANCVSKDVVSIIVDALERDREMYRSLLPSFRTPEQLVPVPQPKPEPEKQSLPKWLPLDGVEWQMPTAQAFPEHELFKMPP